MDFDVADGEELPRLNGLDAVEVPLQFVRQDATDRGEGGLGDKERRFPEPQELRQAVAVVGVLVGNEDAIQPVE